LGDATGMKIESSAHSNKRYARKRIAVFVHPSLLFRSTDADKHDVSIGLPDAGLDGQLLFARDFSKWWRVGAGDSQSREALQQALGERA
jgi:hypothetical protein